MRAITNLTLLGGMVSARAPADTIIDDSPLVVVYYDNWAGWVRDFSPSHVEKNLLSRDMPVRNWVLNYAFYAFNPVECSVVPVDTIDLQKGDKGGWTKDDWNLDQTESWETSLPAGGHLPAFMSLKVKYPHIKLLPSIGGWSRSMSYHDCLINKMDHMIDSVVDHVVVWGWDGVDFDWEYPGCDGAPCGCQGEGTCKPESGFSNVAGAGDWDRYKEFIGKVRSRFNDIEEQVGRRLYITAAMGMNPKLIDGNNEIWSEGIPVEWICDEDAFDWVNLMTYDFYGPWSALTGPLAPLYSNPELVGDQMSIDDSITRFLARCSSPHKLTMGLATYGKTWQEVPRKGTVPGLWEQSTAAMPLGGGTWEAGTLSYFDIKKNILTNPACTRTYDEVSKTPTLFCTSMPPATDIPYDMSVGPVDRSQSNVFVSYEDGQSWKEKMAYARSKGMAGAIIWAASDTGNGQSYAPDATVDLFDGLFEGWFGEKQYFSETSSLAPPPGPIARWAEYPCPVVLDYLQAGETLDTSRCDGLNYSPGKNYLQLPRATGDVSECGKDKVLIHPLGGADNGEQQPPVEEPPVEDTPTEKPETTARPTTRPTTRRTTRMTTRATTKATTKTSVRPTGPTTRSTGPTTRPTTTAAPPSDSIPQDQAIEECMAMITSEPQWEDYCKSNCATYYKSAWCPTAATGPEVAACVISQASYCRII